jgi:cation diffusion facilitator CzcD-associated flavoprotein CzcO
MAAGLYDRLRPGRAPGLPRGATAPSVAIVGAGFSGIGLAIRLKQAGVTDLTIYDKAEGLGGTWRDNTYPGAACDVPSHLYSLSFAPKHDWSRKWAEQPEILEYMAEVADRFGLWPHFSFGSEITSAAWSGSHWELTLQDGTVRTADVLVAATGQLNRPHIPDIPGLASFRGDMFHSARWDHAVPLAGRDVAVIGIGASAIQFVPPVAESGVRSLNLFQRSVNYVGPKADRPFQPWEQWVFANVPGLDRLYRWSIYLRFESRFGAFKKGSLLGRKGTEVFQKGLRTDVAAKGLPEDVVVPDYPIGCRRILISNDWYPTLFRPEVSVVSSPITEVTGDAVVTADGVAHPADVIIFGTGFEATGFLAPMEVEGADGAKLADVWSDGAAAYLGMTVTGFPNFFLLYGPNTNLGHNSVLVMIERQIEYVVRCLRELAVRGSGAVDVTPGAFARDVAAVQERVKSTVWAVAHRGQGHQGLQERPSHPQGRVRDRPAAGRCDVPRVRRRTMELRRRDGPGRRARGPAGRPVRRAEGRPGGHRHAQLSGVDRVVRRHPQHRGHLRLAQRLVDRGRARLRPRGLRRRRADRRRGTGGAVAVGLPAARHCGTRRAHRGR